MSDRTQDLKNLRAVATACKNYTDKKIEDLAWVLGGNTLDISNDTTTAYTKSVPSGVYNPNGTPKALLNAIGGMSYKCYQLLNISDVAETTVNDITYKVKNGVYYLNGTASATVNIIQNVNISEGTYTLTPFPNTTLNGNVHISFHTTGGTWIDHPISSTVNYSVNPTTNIDKIYVYVPSGSSVSNVVIKPMLIKGSTAPTEFQPYFTGIRDSAVSSVVSKDSNDTTIETYSIPNEIQALTGYGWGVNDTCYNYIDFENKKFIQKVARVDLGSLDYGTSYGASLFNFLLSDVKGLTINLLNVIYTPTNDWTTFTNNDLMAYISSGGMLILHNNSYTTAEAFKTAMSGVYLYYELETPIETDISEYLDDNSIEVEAGGTLTFTNTYNQAVPSDIDYLVKEVKA